VVEVCRQAITGGTST